MSKAAFWQRGESLDFTNATTDMIEANTVMTLGSRICVAGTDILPGETGSISESDGMITSQAEGGVKAGFAVSGAAADDNKVLVKINA